MVTGYGNASLNSLDLRQPISNQSITPVKFKVKYIAEDGEVFIDNMMVVFLDVMNHLPEGNLC